MRKILALTAALFGLSLACDDPTGVLGPLDFGVIQGRDQSATAGDAELPEPAVAQVWRDQSGQAFIGAAPLYAQTEVIGVVGAVVCVGETAIEGEPITPHARCTNTNAEGKATFHLTPPTKAGRHRTPIVAEVDGRALTPDIVTADVRAGAATSSQVFTASGIEASAEHMDTMWVDFEVKAFEDVYGNGVPYTVEAEGFLEAVGGDIGTSTGHRVRHTGTVEMGDTTTIRFVRPGEDTTLADAVAEIIPRRISFDGENRDVWAVRAVRRDLWAPYEP